MNKIVVMESQEVAKMKPSLNSILLVVMAIVLMVSGFQLESFELRFGMGLHIAMLATVLLVLAIDFFVALFKVFPDAWNSIKWILVAAVILIISTGGK